MKEQHFTSIRYLTCLSVLIISLAFAERPTCFRNGPETPAAFSVNGNVATMNGVIDGSTPNAVRALLRDHPGVDTILMDFVPGSDNDAANVEAARLIRNAGIKTEVASGGLIASGGVDFFLAGSVRTIPLDVCGVEVHSWEGGGIPNPAALPRTDPEHLLYLRYYRDMGIDDEFYFFTLNAAGPGEPLYNMDDNDLAQFSMTGNAINPAPARPDIQIGKKPGRQSGNNVYSGRGKGQTLRVPLKGGKSARFFFTAQNDSVVFDYGRLRVSSPRRTMKSKTFRLTGGRRNVSAVVKSRGLPLASLNSLQSVQFQTSLKAKSKGTRVRQNLQHTFSSDLEDSRRDVAVAKVKSAR